MAENVGAVAWEERNAYVRETFINALVVKGLQLTGDRSRGSASAATLHNGRVTVTLGRGFPYLPPTVKTNVCVQRTWHQDNNGNLCLYSARERDGQPWLDAEAFLSRIDLWFEKNERGWPDDPPALDMEAYLDLPVDGRFLIYGELGDISDGYIRIKGQGMSLRLLGAGKVAKNTKKGLINGYLASIGDLDVPPRTWEELMASAPEVIRRAIARNRIGVLLVRYQRQTQQGVLAIALGPLSPSAWQPRMILSASSAPATMGLRAGPRASELADKHVYVIGAGALGSHICDGLVRAGLGRLTIRDGDILTPGNMTRHVITDLELCGIEKSVALKHLLEQRPYNRAEIFSDGAPLINPEDAPELFDRCDVIVDATADGGATLMLEDAAKATGNRFISACLQNEGTTKRVDVVPPYHGAAALPSTVNLTPTTSEAFEAGCGEPVSATPPYAIAEAAGMAVRHVVGLLVGRPPSLSGEIREGR